MKSKIYNILFYVIVFYILFLIISISIRKIIQFRLRTLLFVSLPVLNKNNIDYWVDFGTLLGIHREKDIILGDTDCDICIWKKDEDKVRKILKQIAETDNDISFKEKDWGAFRLYYKYVHMDIYKAQLENDIIKIPDSSDTPKELLSNFETINVPFNNCMLKIRQPVEWNSLLRHRYTKEWTVSCHKWWLGYFSRHIKIEVYALLGYIHDYFTGQQ